MRQSKANSILIYKEISVVKIDIGRNYLDGELATLVDQLLYFFPFVEFLVGVR
jgi:hypothetical protein